MAVKKNVKATIVMAWLLYDILNETYLRGRTIQNDENYKEVASMFASQDEENYEKVLRSIKRGFAEVKTELAEYLNENGLETNNCAICSQDDLVLNLTMPSNFNEAATAGLGEAVHDYLKNVAIGDWYLVTNKADAAEYVALAQKSLENIRKSVSKRSRPQRPMCGCGDKGEDSSTPLPTPDPEGTYMVYFGVVAAGWVATQDSVKALGSGLKVGKQNSYSGIELSYERLCYCYPKGLGALTSIKDGNSYELISSYTCSEVQVDGVEYYCYVLTDPVFASNVVMSYK